MPSVLAVFMKNVSLKNQQVLLGGKDHKVQYRADCSVFLNITNQRGTKEQRVQGGTTSSGKINGGDTF